MILPSTVIIASYYISFIFLLGVVLGYLSTEKFCKKYIYSGKISSIYFNFGSWQVHFHHWLVGLSALFFLWIFGIYYLIPQMFIGAINGVIIHDLHTDKKWHRVFYKKT